MSTLELSDLSKAFGRVRAVEGVSLRIPEETFVAILGPSGCGKSTLLRLVAGLERPSRGRILIDDVDITDLSPEKRELGMMFQTYSLFPHMTVLENLCFPLRMRRKGNRPDQVAAANEALELVRLSGMGNRLPRELSGGQQQRVAFARAVIAGPRVLLLDEPLSNLDARLREEMQVELIELHSKLRLTTLFVTHDQAEALSMASLVVLMRDGRIEQIDAPAAIYHRPRTRFAADFIGGANLLRAEIEADPAGGWRARLASGVVFPVPEVSGGRGGEHVVAIRQEDLVLSRDPTGFDGALPTRILTEVYRGSNVRYVATLGDERVSVLTTRRLERNGQEPLYLCWRKDRVIVLEA